jgi:hypothetical protein
MLVENRREVIECMRGLRSHIDCLVLPGLRGGTLEPQRPAGGHGRYGVCSWAQGQICKAGGSVTDDYPSHAELPRVERFCPSCCERWTLR